jgi:UDPglucose 6-dehydrogenase
MKIGVAGLGYVGISNSLLLAQHNEVVGIDIDPERVRMLNEGISPIEDDQVSDFLKYKKLNFRATIDKNEAYSNADFVIICTPTDFDEVTNQFNTKSIESVISVVREISPRSIIVIKSTVPVGYTKKLIEKLNLDKRKSAVSIIFSPEFLREGYALLDNLYPSRIVVGSISEHGVKFAELMKKGARKKKVAVLLTGSTEAESIKLFSNTYLAMRVGFFNELDTYANENQLDTKQIIQGVCMDPRIGDHYNNPSFGYGGYCLPKDTKQILANFYMIAQNLISAIVESNKTRKHYIAECILKKKPSVVGVYRVSMKTGSDNFRSSSILDVIHIIKTRGVKVIVYDPNIKETTFLGCPVVTNFSTFENKADLIITNRMYKELNKIRDKVYTRDIFQIN